MKILLVHNDYGKYSGEEAVVDKMTVMLGGMGYKVAQLRMTTAGVRESLIGKVKGFVSGIYCPSGVNAMRLAWVEENPDVVNIHNLYPFISPAALKECKKAGVPVIMTIHNFRLMCPTGLFMRDNAPCERCLLNGNEWGCIKYNCEHSFFKSIGYAARNYVARMRRYYMDCVDIFACITDFQRQKLIQAGFPSDKITVIPNSMDACNAAEYQLGKYVAYSGRISREKGVDLIIKAARRNPSVPFKLAGAVRDWELLDNLPENVEYIGFLSGQSLKQFYRDARFFIMASKWYEGFPMTILETAQYSKPMIAPNHGGFTEIIGEGDTAIGRLFVPGNANDLEQHVVALWNNPNEIARLGEKAHDKLLREYSTEVIYQKWNGIIKSIL